MKPVQVLLVEDSEDDAFIMTRQLERHDEPIAVTRVDTAFALQAALDAQDWDIVISDYRMPLLSGLLALELVRRHDRNLPFILVSATIAENVAIEAMRSGANDYVMKSKSARLLPAFQRELRAARALHDSVNERDAQRRRIDYLVNYDPTTGFANRVRFGERLAVLLSGASTAGAKLAVLVLQFDRYTTITEIVGQQVGEQLIVQAAERLAKLAGESAATCRLDTDRFALALAGVGANLESVHALHRRIVSTFAPAFVVSGSEFPLEPYVGVALYPDDEASAELLLRDAEAAAAHARESGVAFLFYAEQMTARGEEKLAMETRLRRALERGEFVLHYQPKVDLRTGMVTSVEALIRWMSPELGLVQPAQFIPLLEESGLIVAVGEWALRQAVADHERWSEALPNAPRIAVNVSVIQLHHPGFVAAVESAISSAHGVPFIDLEITESLLMEDVEKSIAKLTAIRDLGVGISIDDFGTGYSSLAYLAKLPVVAVKIDRLFVAGMLSDPGTMRLVATMIELAHSLKLSATAEGVESREQALALRTLGCDEIQGYLIGGPISCEEMSALLESGGPPSALPPETPGISRSAFESLLTTPRPIPAFPQSAGRGKA
jgi:diguanylate cyclase